MLRIAKSGINMISEDYLKSIPKFKEGEIKSFQLLNSVPNNDSDLSERQKRPYFYGHVQIPTQDRIYDMKKDEKGDWVKADNVRIAVVEEYSVETGELIKPKLFVPNMHLPQNPGIFTLREGHADDEELYEYLCICNYNRDNQNRNKRVEPLFYEIKQTQVVYNVPPKPMPKEKAVA